jgi:hypothetical protein
MAKGLRKLRWLGWLLVAAASCRPMNDLKPPKQPQDYNLPSEKETRYSKPLVYPEQKKDDFILKLKQQDEPMKRPDGNVMSPGIIHQ